MLQRLAKNFLAKGDSISALITCERSVSVFYGWGHPMTFHARMLASMEERDKESRDVAKAALGMPVWTLAEHKSQLEETVKLAGFTGVSPLPCLLIASVVITSIVRSFQSSDRCMRSGSQTRVRRTSLRALVQCR